VNDVMRRMMKEVGVVIYSKVLSKHLPGTTKEHNKNSQSS
jgi:hypothetical protein